MTTLNPFLSIGPTRIAIANFLQTIIIENSFIHLDLWSIVHLISGFLLMGWIISLGLRSKYLILLVGLILYEIIEYAFIISGSSFFRGETNLDIIYDLIAGMLGGFIASNYYDYEKLLS